MADSCCSPSSHVPTTSHVSMHAKVICPTNQKVGKAIDTLTLKAVLALPLTYLVYERYYFCPDPDCSTVYYSADGKQLFTEDHLREKVYQKHPEQEESLICYCFQYSVRDIREEIKAIGSSRVVEQITAGIRAGQCACDIRNPQGNCCLGNVRQTVSRIDKELGRRVEDD